MRSSHIQIQHIRLILLTSFSTWQDATKEKEAGSVDLNLATSLAEVKGGHGFDITTPGRNWLFVAESRDAQVPTSIFVALQYSAS